MAAHKDKFYKRISNDYCGEKLCTHCRRPGHENCLKKRARN